LCRPKNGEEISVADMMASATPSRQAKSARIIRGEILVAIPEGPYDGEICANIAKPLLLNPKVTKLLNRSDPLAPKRDNKKTRKTSVRKHSAPLIETVFEESCSFDDRSTTAASTTGRREHEIGVLEEYATVQKALQNAAEAAATSNAEIVSDDNISALFPIQGLSANMWKSNMTNLQSRSQLQRSTSIGDSASSVISHDNSFVGGIPFDSSMTGNNMDDSLSLCSSCCTDSQYRLKRLRRRRIHRPLSNTRKWNTSYQFMLTSAFVLIVMVLRYVMVSSGKENESAATPEIVSSGFSGVMEMAQVVLAFYIFCKWQNFLNGQEDPMNHPIYQVMRKSLKYFESYVTLRNNDREYSKE